MTYKKINNQSQFLRKEPCPKCRASGHDSKGDNFAIYMNPDGKESGHCWKCGFTKASSEFKKESYKDRYEYSIQMSGEFTVDMWSKLKETSDVNPRGWRSLTKEACAYYGVRNSFDEQGQLKYQYYPITKDNELVGVKWRSREKNWFNRGSAGADCDLFGQISFRTTTSKTVVIASR